MACEGVPDVQVDDQMHGRRRLMPARVVVVAGDAVEAELLVDDGQRVLGGVDGALLERLEDLAAGQHRHGRADPLDHLAAQAGEANLQALHLLQRIDPIAEPSRRFRPADPAEKDVRVLLGIQRLAELPPAGLEPPGRELPWLHAEGNRADERGRGNAMRPWS